MDAPMDTLSEVTAELLKRAAESIEPMPDAVRAVQRLTELFREQEYRAGKPPPGLHLVIVKGDKLMKVIKMAAMWAAELFRILDDQFISLERLLISVLQQFSSSCSPAEREYPTLGGAEEIERSEPVVQHSGADYWTMPGSIGDTTMQRDLLPAIVKDHLKGQSSPKKRSCFK